MNESNNIINNNGIKPTRKFIELVVEECLLAAFFLVLLYGADNICSVIHSFLSNTPISMIECPKSIIYLIVVLVTGHTVSNVTNRISDIFGKQ